MPAHFVEKPGRVPLALRLVGDYTQLNFCLIRDQALVFPTWEEIRQQLGKECQVWATSCSPTIRSMWTRRTSRRQPSCSTVQLKYTLLVIVTVAAWAGV